MRIFGFNISRSKATEKALVPVSENRGWWPLIRESYAGAWQHNVTVSYDSVISNPTVFACVSRISSDAAGMPAYLEEQDSNGIWVERYSSAFSPVLEKPNGYQNHIQFKESWFLSKLLRGNAYVLKRRDLRNVVAEMHVLDPNRVKPMVSDSGEMFYQLSTDNVVGINEDIVVPASEIIHDRYHSLHHPLVGVSPLFAAGVPATAGLAIQSNATRFFNAASRPGGLLVAEGAISDETATRLKETFEAGFSGENIGRLAVVGDNLKYQNLTIDAEDAQLIEQLNWTSEAICQAYQMPKFMVGVGDLPANSTVEMIMRLYYNLCLRSYVEQFEECMRTGLNLPSKMRVQLDEEQLLRIDKTALYKMIVEGIRGGLLTPNEGRKLDNRPPIKGGDTVYLQEQDHSLEALATRDAGPDPFGTESKSPAPSPPANDNTDAEANAEAAKALLAIHKGLS